MSRFRENCPQEDAVLSSFLDGEPEAPLPADLTGHLEACPACRRALEQSRSLDALLAAQTRTELSEAEAEALLSFLDPEEASPPRRSAPLLLPAAFVLAACLLVWLLLPGGEGKPDPSPEGGSPSLFDQPGILVDPGPGRRAGAWGGPRHRDLLAALCGSGRMSEHELRQGLLQILRPPSPLLPGAGRPEPGFWLEEPGLGPWGFDHQDRLRAAGLRWLLGEIDRGRLGFGDFRAALPALLESRGAQRLRLLAAFRRHQRRIEHWLRSRWRFPGFQKEMGRRGPELVGALGLSALVDELLALPGPPARLAARQARRSGDGPCLGFLADLFLETCLRGKAFQEEGLSWFAGLSPTSRGILARELSRRWRAERQYERRIFTAELAVRLGLGILPGRSSSD